MLDLEHPQSLAAVAYPAMGLNLEPSMGLVIKVACELVGGEEAIIRDDAPTIEFADRFAGDPVGSPLVASAETVPWKQGCDVLIHGSAQPPPDARAMEVSCALARAGGEPFWSKALWVVGERRKRRIGYGEPQRLDAAVPITYDLAYGGPVDGSERHPANPAGRGYRPFFWSRRPAVAPMIEWPRLRRPRGRPVPPGFGPIAASWAPRNRRFGKLDEQASESGEPVYRKPPAANAFNAAPDDQQLPKALRGDERLSLKGLVPGCSPTEAASWRLPGVTPRPALVQRAGSRYLDTALDTLVVQADAALVTLTWRAWVPLREARDALGVRVEVNDGQA